MDRIRRILTDCCTIAVLGAHRDSWKAACYVPDYLHSRGYRILPVNPRFAGELMWDERCVASLIELRDPVDLVDVFRAPAQLAAHEPEILAMTPRPEVVWLQLGIRDDAFAARLAAAGIEVVQDRCTLADHRSLRLGPIA